MKLIAEFSAKGAGAAGKQSMTREQLIGLIASDSKFMDDRTEITEYVRGLKAGEGLSQQAIETGYQAFKDKKSAAELANLAASHGLPVDALQSFVETVLVRKIFDGQQLTDLLAPLDLGWKARTQKELALMSDLVPLLKKRAAGRDIAGLKAYEE
jgi:type I restriction enzyme R subunit